MTWVPDVDRRFRVSVISTLFLSIKAVLSIRAVPFLSNSVFVVTPAVVSY